MNQGSADLEIDLTKDDRIHGYYVIQRDLRIEPQLPGATPANIPGFGDSRNGQRQLMTINEDHVFSPSLLNTVRLGYSRLHLFNSPPVFNPANFHITLPVGAPIGVGLPLINVSGNFVIGAPTGEPSGRGDTEVVLNDTFNWLRGRNFFAIGGEIRLAYNNNLAENIGSFTFPTMANFLADQSSAFATMLGTGNNRVSQPAYGLFAQDSLKFNPNFTLNIGLRYEVNTSPSEAKGRFTNFDITSGTLFTATRPYQNNKLNLEPRIGIAWDPFGSGRTSVRAAYAILDQVPTTNLVNGLSGNPPFATPISITSSTNSITLENPTAQSASLNLGPSATDPNFDNLYTQDWNLNVERQLTQSLGLTIAYVGSKSTHLQIAANVNQPIVTSGFYGTTKPFPTLPLTSPVLPAQCAPPNPACVLGNITRNESPGNSNYNALWVTLSEHRFHGLQFVAAYTFSKSLDYSSIFTDSVPLQNARNPRGDYGLSEFDVRNRFILSGFYQLPFQGNRLASGWEVGAITMTQSGNPITPLLTIGPGAGISFTVRPDALALVTGTGQPSQFYTKTTLCEPFNGTPTGGTPAIRPCASTPTAAFAVPCTFSGTPSSPGGSSYPVVPGTCHPGSTQRDSLPGPSFVHR